MNSSVSFEGIAFWVAQGNTLRSYLAKLRATSYLTPDLDDTTLTNLSAPRLDDRAYFYDNIVTKSHATQAVTLTALLASNLSPFVNDAASADKDTTLC
jgi:hypothetical protein